MKNMEEAILPNFRSILSSKVALFDLKPSLREANYAFTDVYQPTHLITIEWKILAWGGLDLEEVD